MKRIQNEVAAYFYSTDNAIYNSPARSLDKLISRPPDNLISRSPDKLISRSPDKLISRSPDKLIDNSPGRFIDHSHNKLIDKSIEPGCDPVCAFVEEVCRAAKAHPEAFEPFRGDNPRVADIFLQAGLTLIPTVERTTLVASVCGRYFLKILHALTLKERIKTLAVNRAESLRRLSEKLRTGGICVPVVEAWGTFNTHRRRFFVMRRVAGLDLYEISVVQGQKIDVEIFRRVMDEVLKLHAMGYLMGDAHPAHVFIDDGRVSGIIDIDAMRRNFPPGLRGIARDLAGLNYPELLLDGSERAAILDYYISHSGMRRVKREHERLREYFKTYSEQRWKAQTDGSRT